MTPSPIEGTVALQKNVISRGYYLLLAVYGMDVAGKRPKMTRVQLGFILCFQVFYFWTSYLTAIKYWIEKHSTSYIPDSFINCSYTLDTATSAVESFFLLIYGHRLAVVLDKFTAEMSRLDTRDRRLFAGSRWLFFISVATGLTQLSLFTSSIWLKPNNSTVKFATMYLWQAEPLPGDMRVYSLLQNTYNMFYIFFNDMFFCTFLNYFIFCAYVAYKTFQTFNECVLRRYARRVQQLSEEVALVMQSHKKLSDLVSEMNEVTSTVMFLVLCLTLMKICISVRGVTTEVSFWGAVDIVSLIFSATHLLGFVFASAMLNAEAHKIPDILMECIQTGMPAYDEKVFSSSTLLWAQLSANPVGLKASRFIVLSYGFISQTCKIIITYTVILYEMAK